METIHTVEWMKQVARQARAESRIVGFVPTMGALHEGHLSLIRAAQQQCSPVVVSIFVNPTQFAPSEDFSKYPRPIERDRALLEELNVDYLFAPPPEEIYPRGFRTHVEVEGLSSRCEGRSRAGHFRGVTTVVLKLFEIVQPTYAYFGRKDAQQARIVRQMTGDLNLDAQVVVCPIVREADGLALSSRNAYLNPDNRCRATVLYRSLEAARREILGGERDATRLLGRIRELLKAEPAAEPDYVELVDADSFEPVALLRGECLAVMAVRLGGVRLLDNMLITQRPDGSFEVSL